MLRFFIAAIALVACGNDSTTVDASVDATAEASACSGDKPPCYPSDCFTDVFPGVACKDGGWVCIGGGSDPNACPCGLANLPPFDCTTCDDASLGQITCDLGTHTYVCPDGGYRGGPPPNTCPSDAGTE
jgi:hypothetical protein